MTGKYTGQMKFQFVLCHVICSVQSVQSGLVCTLLIMLEDRFYLEWTCMSMIISWDSEWLTLPHPGWIQQKTNLWYFSYFSQKTGFDISCKLSPVETICMKCQNLFSGKNKKNISICFLLKILPRVLSVAWNLPYIHPKHWDRQAWAISVDPDQMPNEFVELEFNCPVKTITVMSVLVHILLPKTDNCPSWINGRKYFIINFHKRMLTDPIGIKSTTSWSPFGCASNWATEVMRLNVQIFRVYIVTFHYYRTFSISKM